MLRLQETYGDVRLSIIAGKWAYCEPQADLPDLAQYSSVEVALLSPSLRGAKELGLPEPFHELFEEDIGPYISEDTLALLRSSLQDRANGVSPKEMQVLYEARAEMLQDVPRRGTA